MRNRIKIIYRLTVIALLALVVVQGYWLYNQYTYSLHKYEDEVFEKTIDVFAIDKELRIKLQDTSLKAMTQWEMNVSQNDTTSSGLNTEYILDAYIINTKIIHESLSLQLANSLSSQLVDSLSNFEAGIKKHQFIVKEPSKQHDVYDALNQFCINELCPFQVERFDSLLQNNALKALSIKIENVDSISWNSSIIRHNSFWNPKMEVTYPFNILGKEQVRIIYKLGVSPVLAKMFDSLVVSIILSILLVFCLVYQTRTIFKQQRIDELRKSFIKTMIHELKRPVATLKMCISFMKNDRMMLDKTMKDEIIRSSQNELDNLSSYFSKLRDLTYGDMETIPLNLSTFDLKELINECLDKQYLPTDREINFATYFDESNMEITADKMHISNIICNLLENAVKYSEGETSIHINCSSVEDKYRIEVSDNGFGIPLDECAHIFDKYFRSAKITDKNIPGIGLGLSYVKLLLTAHKGEITLESTFGAGSKFIIEIPKRQ